MATPLNRNRIVRFSSVDVGYPLESGNPTGVTYGGERITDVAEGWKATSSERKSGKQLPYDARKASGYVVRPMSNNNNGYHTYVPQAIYAQTPYIGNEWLTDHVLFAKARNKAWERFVDRARGDAADLGVMLGEGKEAFNMVADRMIGLRKSYKALRRGDFRRFLRELSVDPKRKHRSKTRSTAAEASGLWLEYWFGWSPFVSSIYDGLEVVTGPGVSGRRRIHGSARVTLPRRTTSVGTANSVYGSYRVMSFEGVCFWKQGATVWVDSPNLLLLNRLGLINPAAVAWELVPFSFVVDWFTKAGDVINGWTDLVGVGVSNPYSTRYVRGKSEVKIGRASPTHLANQAEVHFRAGRMKRVSSLSTPVATFPSLLNYGNSHTRAATAASLLTQIFLAK